MRCVELKRMILIVIETKGNSEMEGGTLEWYAVKYCVNEETVPVIVIKFTKVM